MVKIKLLDDPTNNKSQNGNVRCLVSDGKSMFHFYCERQEHEEVDKITKLKPGNTIMVPELNPQGVKVE